MRKQSKLSIAREALREIKKEVCPYSGNAIFRRLLREAGRDGMEDWEFREEAIDALMSLSDHYFDGRLHRGFTYRLSISGKSVWIGLKSYEE